MLYWTRNELHEFFFQKMGWLLLAGVAIFSLSRQSRNQTSNTMASPPQVR